MLFKHFLKNCLENRAWDRSVYIFVASQYNPVIASYFVQGLKKRYHFINFSLTDRLFSEFESAACTTFLGQTSLLWLGNCSEYDTSTQKKLRLFLESYAGPHTIIAFWNEKDYGQDSKLILFYEKEFDFKTIQYFFEYTLEKKITTEVPVNGYTPEQSIIFYFYTFFINDPYLLAQEGWTEKLFAKESSLFELSKLFFAKKKEPFFVMWKKVSELYSPIFWTVFWSEQLWNAFLVVYLRNKKEFHNAKQVQGRLPFSFLQYDWQNYTPQELQEAHTLLLSIDRNLKLSASADSIELLYYTFFIKK